MKSSEQSHLGPYTFTRSSFTAAWRAETSSPSSSSLSFYSLRPRFVAMLIEKRLCVRPYVRRVLSDCPKIQFVVSVTTKHRQTTQTTSSKTTILTMMATTNSSPFLTRITLLELFSPCHRNHQVVCHSEMEQSFMSNAMEKQKKVSTNLMSFCATIQKLLNQRDNVWANLDNVDRH